MLEIRPFTPDDQATVKALILAGLGERFGSIDYSLNPDLNDIQTTYVDAGHLFFVGEAENELVGSGCLMLKGDGFGRIVRMSVSQTYRGMGFGRNLTTHLLNTARQHTLTTLLVETEHNWTSAIKLYESVGFVKTHRDGTEQHFRLNL